jgi:hypothetical protein
MVVLGRIFKAKLRTRRRKIVVYMSILQSGGMEVVMIPTL